MADWYASSTAHAAVPQWAATTAYTVGQFVRGLATPAEGQKYVQRCTIAGTSGGTEPSWSAGDTATTISGTATFTNVTGQSAYGWSAPAGNLVTLSATVVPRAAAGDRVFVSSDHSESIVVSSLIFGVAAGWGAISIISVNRAGTVPPGAADVLPGAVVTRSAVSNNFEAMTPVFYQGITFNLGASVNYFNAGYTKSYYFKDCAFVMANASVSKLTGNNPRDVTFDNTTYQVTNAASVMEGGQYSGNFTWLNTPSAIPGTPPTTLLNSGSGAGGQFTLRGVDLSAITGTLVAAGASDAPIRVLLDECRIAAGVTRMYTPAAGAAAGDLVELVNCFNGTNVVNERYRAAGALTTDRTTTMSNGAIDATGAFSFKLVSSSRSDRFVEALDTFFFDLEYPTIGVSKTATVEIISSGTLNNNDVFLTLEYLGTAGSTLAKYASSKPSSLSSTALPTSSVTWNSPPATPVKQYLQVTFTPQTAGRMRGRVHLGKPSTTIWVNPQIVIA